MSGCFSWWSVSVKVVGRRHFLASSCRVVSCRVVCVVSKRSRDKSNYSLARAAAATCFLRWRNESISLSPLLKCGTRSRSLSSRCRRRNRSRRAGSLLEKSSDAMKSCRLLSLKVGKAESKQSPQDSRSPQTLSAFIGKPLKMWPVRRSQQPVTPAQLAHLAAASGPSPTQVGTKVLLQRMKMGPDQSLYLGINSQLATIHLTSPLFPARFLPSLTCKEVIPKSHHTDRLHHYDPIT